MAYTTQYIGSRYVPLFAEPAEWSSARTYEPLTIVMHEGNSYTSKQYVPIGIEITNEKFWALTGNYNAQVEAYRKEVRTILPLDETPTEGSTKGVTSDGIKKAITAETTRATTAEETNAAAIAAETTRATTAEETNATAIAAETTRATTAEETNATAIANEVTRAKSAEETIASAIANNDAIVAKLINSTLNCFDTLIGNGNTLQANLSTLQAGTYAYVNGYSVKGQGAAFYKIESTAPVSNNSHAYSKAEPYGNYYTNGTLYANLIVQPSMFADCFGVIGDDPNIDNGPMIQYAITYMNDIHGELRFGNHTYTMRTGVTASLTSMNITGIGSRNNPQFGSTISWQGTGFAFTFNSTAFSLISDISIYGNGANYGIDMADCKLSEANRLHISNVVQALYMSRTAGYMRFNGCSFTIANYVSGVPLVKIGNEDNAEIKRFCEYVYFTECSFDGSHLNAIGIQIIRGQFLYFDKCDICNWWSSAVQLLPTHSNDICRDIWFTDLSLVNSSQAFLFDCSVKAIQRIRIDGTTFRATTYDKDVPYIQQVGTNDLELQYNANVQSIGGIAWDIQYGNGAIYINGYVNDYTLVNTYEYENTRNRVWAFNVPYNQTSYTTVVPIGASPFKGNIIADVWSRDDVNFSYSINNTIKGAVNVTINFKEATTSAHIFFIKLYSRTY